MKIRSILGLVLSILLLTVCALAQNTQLITRKVTKTDRFDFGVGGTVAVTGAPDGAIKIIPSATSEIEITADIELQAPTEADLDLLAGVTGFVTDESISRTAIISAGTHNKLGDKKLWKKFPKRLIGLPFRIDYTIAVPKYCDLDIQGGHGDLSVSGVQGSMKINFLHTDAKVDVISGTVIATISSGTADFGLGVNGWKGRAAAIQLGNGELTIRLPSNTSAEIDALILRTGAIENHLVGLKQRDRKTPFTEKAMLAKAGVGGTELKFTVGDGTLKLENLVRH
jgi:hypothetical protein